MSRGYDPAGDLERSIADAYRRADIATDLQRRLATVHGTGYDADGLVCAVVSGAGALVDLKFHPAAPGLGPARLGEAIVSAARYAEADARQRGYTMMALALGDEATAVVEATDSPTPARALGWDTVSRSAPEPHMPQPQVPPAIGADPADDAEDDDLSTFDASIFRSDR
jgi:hypothetical protein